MDLSKHHFQLVSNRTLISCGTQYVTFLSLVDEEDLIGAVAGVTEIVEQLEAIENELRRRGMNPDMLYNGGLD